MELKFNENELKVIIKDHVLRWIGSSANGKIITVSVPGYRTLECTVEIEDNPDYSMPVKRDTYNVSFGTVEGDLDTAGRKLVPGS